MKRLFTIIIILLILALSGCTGQDISNEIGGQTFERTNPDLNGKMMNLELLPNDARAGENITANLVVGNIGKENIVSETVEIRVKAMSLEDSLGNLALVAMSNEKKTMTFTVNFNEVIKPDTIKQLTYVFPTPRELKGRNLAGRYEITVTLSVNGQKVESKSIKLRLRSGKPRDSGGSQVNAKSDTIAPTPALQAAVTATVVATTIAKLTPTPATTPEAVTTVDSYIFSWDDVPGKDDDKLRMFLKNKFVADWLENAKIEKSDDSKVINLTSGNDFISLTINDEKTKLSLLVNDGRTGEFVGMNENGKLKIYSGKIVFTRIKSWTFGEPTLTLDAGDWIQWQNLWDDEFEYTLVETKGKFSNITVRNRKFFLFNTTGTYEFQLFYPKMRVIPPVQTITVKLNQSK